MNRSNKILNSINEKEIYSRDLRKYLNQGKLELFLNTMDTLRSDKYLVKEDIVELFSDVDVKIIKIAIDESQYMINSYKESLKSGVDNLVKQAKKSIKVYSKLKTILEELV